MEKCLHCLPVEMVTMLKSFSTNNSCRSQRTCYSNFSKLEFVYLVLVSTSLISKCVENNKLFVFAHYSSP